MGEHFSNGDMSTYGDANLTVCRDTIEKMKDDFLMWQDKLEGVDLLKLW